MWHLTGCSTASSSGVRTGTGEWTASSGHSWCPQQSRSSDWLWPAHDSPAHDREHHHHSTSRQTTASEIESSPPGPHRPGSYGPVHCHSARQLPTSLGCLVAVALLPWTEGGTLERHYERKHSQTVLTWKE